MASMTRDKFEQLCERVLVPRIGDLLHRLLIEREDDTLDVIARELASIERKIDEIAQQLRRDR